MSIRKQHNAHHTSTDEAHVAHIYYIVVNVSYRVHRNHIYLIR